MEKIKRVKASQIPDATDIDGFKAFGIKVNTDGTIDNVKVPMDLLKGTDGVNGKSAYQIAVGNGYVGTETAWLLSLKGADGTLIFEELTEEQKLSLKGDKGDTGVGIPIGGATGQQLVKKSNADYDFEWQTPAGGGDMLMSVYDSNGNGIVDNAEKVNGFTVETNVPANAKFTDTTYSEITEAEINTGTASTLRTITARRVTFILSKVSTLISNAISVLTKSDVGLGNVNNTSDLNKPVSAAQQTALDAKIDANKFQVVTSLPTSPVTGVFYFIKE